MSTSLVATLTCVPFLRLVTCFRTQDFQHLAIHSCGDLVHWRSRIVSALGFSSCQSVLVSGVCIHMAATSLTMHGCIDTADSDLMHHQYRLSLLSVESRPSAQETLLTSLRLPVENSMRLFFKKPVIMFRTSLISSLRTLATRTLRSCSTRTPLSLTLWCLHSRRLHK